MDADGAEDVKHDVLKLLGNPQTDFHSAHPGFTFPYAIAIKSSWSPATRLGASNRFIDSMLK